MSLKNLGNKQTIVIHNCEIENQKYNLVIAPHTQNVEYIHTKRQTLIRTIISKQRHITRKRFSKHRIAFSESEVSSLGALYKIEDTIKKNLSNPGSSIFFRFRNNFNFIEKRKKQNKKEI